MYGERVGCLHLVAGDKETAATAGSIIKVAIRVVYGTPPLQGARIAAKVLSDPVLKQ